ncbi:MAG: homoserine kinase [Lautropia sp.]
MAVFTAVSDQELAHWLTRYDVGALVAARGIADGIENTNYFVDTAGGAWVLTLIERIAPADLPFHLRLMKHLATRGIRCPEPVADRGGALWSPLAGKPATLVTRLAGHPVDAPAPVHCAALGRLLARMHLAAADFGAAPPNPRGRDWWADAVRQLHDRLPVATAALVDDELAAQQRFAATPAAAALPVSPVHADCFRDNVLFDGDDPGIIDFYFAGVDSWGFDLAVACNDWCIDAAGRLDPPRVAALFTGYQAVRPLLPAERTAWPMLLRAAALRFWLSRLYDHFLPRDAAMLRPKDPATFERILAARRDAPALLPPPATD